MQQNTALSILPTICNESVSEHDLQLLRRIANKDASGLSELYDIHSKCLYTIIYYILRDVNLAEKLLQEVFIQIWEKIDSFDKALGNPLTWMIRIARNKSIESKRNNSVNIIREADLERVMSLSEDSEFFISDDTPTSNTGHDEILNALKSLNQTQRDQIEFTYLRGYSQSELSRHFDIPYETVRINMRATMILLRKKLKNLI
ncbi:MAG: sigma-70 family RNA polymerase sigma factor [bacterium]